MTTDTPDVDSAAFEERGLPGSLVVHVDFARRLRREANEAAQTIESLKKDFNKTSGMLATEITAHEGTKALLEKQKSHSLALQRIVEAICTGKPCPDEPAAPEQDKLGKAFHKKLMQQEANRLHDEADAQRALADERRVAAEKLAAAKEESVRLAAQMIETSLHDDESVSYAAEVEAFTEELHSIVSRLGVYLPAELQPAVSAAVEGWQQFKLDHAKVVE